MMVMWNEYYCRWANDEDDLSLANLLLLCLWTFCVCVYGKSSSGTQMGNLGSPREGILKRQQRKLLMLEHSKW